MLCMLSTESYIFLAIADSYQVISPGVPIELGIKHGFEFTNHCFSHADS